LFDRVTGRLVLDGPDVHLDVLMPIEALQGQPVAAELAGHGPITPHLAAQLVDQAGCTWYRRLFTGLLAKWIRTRDRHRCHSPPPTPHRRT